jgi:hypothetical protein
MPTNKIPIWLGSNKNVDEYGLGALSAELRDAFIDELQNVRKRPGVEPVIALGTDARIDGLYWWEKQEALIAVSDSSVFKITRDTEGAYSYDQYSYAVSGTTLASGTDVSFADYGSVLYAANGGKIFNIPSNAASPVAALADVDAPDEVTKLAVLDSYLICNFRNADNQTEFWWSEVLTPEDWQGEFATAESNVDDLVNIKVSNGLIYLLGTRSLEIWYNDGVTPFVPLSQGTIQIGTCAPESFVWCRDAFYWLDEQRQLVTLQGNQAIRLPPENIQSLTLYLQGLDVVSDARGQYIAVAGQEFYILQLPTEDKTIAYNITNHTWALWSRYISATGQYEQWYGDQLDYSDLWNKRLLGHGSNGIIYEFSTDYTYDGGSEAEYIETQAGPYLLDQGGSPILMSGSGLESFSEPVRTLVRTGQINHDTMTVIKHSAKYTLLCKRTGDFKAEITSMSVRMRWRDNGTDNWSAWKAGSIDNVDNSTFRIAWRRNGQYYTRQLEIVNDDDAPLLIVHLEETFDYGV